MTGTTSRTAALVLLATVTLTLAGCPLRRDRGDNGEPLAPEVRQAIDDVIARFTPVSEALAAFFDGFEGIDLDGDGTFGECPTGTVAVIEGVYAITLDYGDGCTNEYYGAEPASGSATLAYDSNTQSLSLEYEDLTVGGRTVNGSLDLAFMRDENTRSLTGAIDLTTSTGSVAGTLDIRFGLVTNTITINAAELVLAETGGDSFTITIDDLVIRPVANGNFVPESGTITFEVPNDGPGPETLTVVVRFTSQSPNTRRVSVTVGNAPATTYTIPSL